MKTTINCKSSTAVTLIKLSGGGMPNAIITDFSLDLATNHQFLHALDHRIYLYPFGDRVGELVLTGIGFSSGHCEGKSVVTGKESVNESLDYYLTHRLSTKKGLTPISIIIAEKAEPFLCFLSHYRIVAASNNLPIVQWVMRFSVIPPE